MNAKKIAFIICVNNELYYEECAWYINQIGIPEGYETDIICITEAESMTMAYNAAMESSDAKYKVYLHQDVFIYNRNFIEDVVRIFESDSNLGMIGVIGGRKLPADADIWDFWDCGCAYGCNSNSAFPITLYQKEAEPYIEVEAIDGMLMVTQYDMKWREDLNLGWDFYDISQSLEFRRNHYKVGVPFQKEPWCMHDCGYSKLNNYDAAREKVLFEYRDFFTQSYTAHYNLELLSLEEQIFQQIRQLMEQGDWKSACQIATMVRERQISNTNLQYALNILEILEAEQKQTISVGFADALQKWEEIKGKYDEIKFLLRHAERGTREEQVEMLKEMLGTGAVSKSAAIVIINHTIVDIHAAARRVMPELF